VPLAVWGAQDSGFRLSKRKLELLSPPSQPFKLSLVTRINPAQTPPSRYTPGLPLVSLCCPQYLNAQCNTASSVNGGAGSTQPSFAALWVSMCWFPRLNLPMLGCPCVWPLLWVGAQGLYKSSGNYCTQCEAEGFWRITFFQVSLPSFLSACLSMGSATPMLSPSDTRPLYVLYELSLYARCCPLN